MVPGLQIVLEICQPRSETSSDAVKLLKVQWCFLKCAPLTSTKTLVLRRHDINALGRATIRRDTWNRALRQRLYTTKVSTA